MRLTNTSLSKINSIPADSPNPKSEAQENLMQNRQSIRKFKKEAVAADLIHHLVSMASYAATGKNENAVQFTVVDSREGMEKLRELAYLRIKQYFEEDRLPKEFMYLNNFRELWYDKQIDIIFRDAPHILFTSSPKTGTEPLLDNTITMTYFDLLANTNGIGTLWDGFAKYVFEDVAPELKKELGIPKDHQIASVLIFGKPAVKFARSIQNDNPNIKRIRLQ